MRDIGYHQPAKSTHGGSTVNTAPSWTKCLLRLLLFPVVSLQLCAETAYYKLENVRLDDQTQMMGIFSWTYELGAFEDGTGQFISLTIPHTSHDETDLVTTIDPTQSIEITFDGNAHDDGIDIMLVLLEPLTPSTSAGIDTAKTESKYSIGGNGFHDGFFLSGKITPISPSLKITVPYIGFVSLSWEPDLPGYILQESPTLYPTSWEDSSSGSTNPIILPSAAQKRFYRLTMP